MALGVARSSREACEDLSELEAAITQLVAGQTIDACSPSLRDALTQLGAEAIDDGRFRWPAALVPLDESRILAALDPLARRRLRTVEVLASVDSTNRYLLDRIARAGTHGVQDSVTHPGLVTTECQLAGRGRLGRRWNGSLGASIAVSLAYQLARSPQQLGGLSLVVGLAVVDALDPHGDLGLKVKWPNDVFYGAGKLCGVLIELATVPVIDLPVSTVVVGIGVNVAPRPSQRLGLDREVASIVDSVGPPPDRNLLLASLAIAVSAFIERFEADGFEPFVQTFDRLHLLHGRRCTVTGDATAADGAAGYVVRVLGAAADGALRVEADGREHRLVTGDVSLRAT
ncbi:MAG: biotin--[acetyl-CoA-carboxylase] ligase [Pseudomonadota bacterium]